DLFVTAIVDSIAGGFGTDTIRLDTTAAVTMTNTVSFSRVSGVEKLVVNGANSNAISLALDVTAFTAAGIKTVDLTSDTNVAGINVINASTQADTTNGLSLLGSAGADSITGGSGDDSVVGGDGNDTITGGPGADSLDGGAGNDSIVGGTGADSIFGGSGADTIVGEQADALIDGGSETDLLQVGASFTPTTDGQLTGIEAVTLTAAGLTLNLATQTEPFTINGFATGTSIIVGGTMAEFVSGNAVIDTITGAGGTDRIVINDAIAIASTVSFARAGTTEQLLAQTQSASKRDHNVKVSSATNLGSIVAIDLSGDTNTSSSGVIDLSGVTTAMTLKGVGAGANTITGGGGVDTLVGGTGADTFVYNTMAEFVSGNAVIDTITGAGGTDRI
ncbi:MAG: hypothetical protein EBW58_12580, partial [Betaproteobacteria bacterium]|nr:hypothetical protein [Betaproteobacteria bacterium]